jgi:hypothetical protein
MKTKIKFNIIDFLYKIFAFLADKTNGWKIFVKPKLLLGAIVVGMSVNACSSDRKQTNDNDIKGQDEIVVIKNSDTIISDTTIEKNLNASDTIFIGTCYDVVLLSDTIGEQATEQLSTIYINKSDQQK